MGRLASAANTVYVLECSDGTLYTGWTNKLEQRLQSHRQGTASKYTRSRRPVFLRAFWQLADKTSALRHEAAFKRFSRQAKVATLERGEVLGTYISKPPFINLSTERMYMPDHTPPTQDEVAALCDEAKHSQVRIETAKGAMVLRLFPEDAPIHVASFMKLIKANFYHGLTFHRVEPGFVIQGGCPSGTGTGGPGYQIPAEFNKRHHILGTLAMARSSDPNSAGSQFYLCLAPAPFLDGQYTVFGETIEGIDVIPKIARDDVMKSVTIEPITA